MGRKAYFPDKIFNKDLFEIKECTEAISDIKSNVVQSGGLGGSCFILAPLYAILQKRGQQVFKNFITDDADDKKVVVHFFFEGEPYDVVVDKSTINIADFKRSSADINMIIKAYIASGLRTSQVTEDRYKQAQYDESTEQYKQEYNEKLIDYLLDIPNGGDPTVFMQVLGLDISDNKGQEFMTDALNNITDIFRLENELLYRLKKQCEDKDTIVCLGIDKGTANGPYPHAVTLTNVNVEERTITYYDQETERGTASGKTVTVPIANLMSRDKEPKVVLNQIFAYKLEAGGCRPVEYDAIDVDNIRRVINEKNEPIYDDKPYEKLVNKFKYYCKDKNDPIYNELAKLAEDDKKGMTYIIKNVVGQTRIKWNNVYEFNKVLNASSVDPAQKEDYDKQQQILEAVLPEAKKLYFQKNIVKQFKDKIIKGNDELTAFAKKYPKDVDKTINDALRHRKILNKTPDEIEKILGSSYKDDNNYSKEFQKVYGTVAELHATKVAPDIFIKYIKKKYQGEKFALADQVLGEQFRKSVVKIWEANNEITWNNADEIKAAISYVEKNNEVSSIDDNYKKYHEISTILKQIIFDAKRLTINELESGTPAYSAMHKLNFKGEPLAFAYAQILVAESMMVPTSINSAKWDAVVEATRNIMRVVNNGESVTNEMRQEAYKACRIYLDSHTANGTRQDDIDGQHFEGGRLRKAAVVYYLKEMMDYAGLEGFANLDKTYNEYCKANHYEPQKLKFDKLEESLGVNVPKHIKKHYHGENSNTWYAYKELNEITNNKITKWKEDIKTKRSKEKVDVNKSGNEHKASSMAKH